MRRASSRARRCRSTAAPIWADPPRSWSAEATGDCTALQLPPLCRIAQSAVPLSASQKFEALSMTGEPRPPLCAPHDPNPRRPRMAVPPNACDCHAHVFGPGDRYPFTPHGLYTPADALPADHLHMLDALGLTRGVLTQPSVYGTGNDAMLDAIKLDPGRLRGIAVVP